MADKAYITPNVLKWARESAKMPLEVAARKVGKTPEKLQEWEEGASQPTINQAETLAKAYKRPFALLFLPDVPRDFLPLQDFRRSNSKELSTSSVFIIREIQQKQAWIRDVYEDNNEAKLPFIGRFTMQNSPQQVAKDILSTLQITPGSYSAGNPIKEWIDKAEAKGIFISRTSFINSHMTLDSEEIQGFAIADPYAPFIFLNTDDWAAPQLFTLVHEIAHLWIAQTGISNEVELGVKHRNSMHPVELFCNEVAAYSLLPSELFSNIESTVFDDLQEVVKVSKHFGVSTYAFLVRALNLQRISLDKYRRLKAEDEVAFQAFLLKEEEKKALKKEKTGGPNYYVLQINKNSRLFTQIVLDAFRGGAIAATQASNLLNIKSNNFPKLTEYLYK